MRINEFLREPCRDGQRERRALPDNALERQVAAEHARKLPRDGKAETCSLVLTRIAGVDLLEFLKHFPVVLLGDPDAAVFHTKRDHAARLLRHLDGDAAGFRELCSVAEKIDEDLPDLHDIRREGWKIRLNILRHRKPFRLYERFDYEDAVRENRGNIFALYAQ